MIVEFIKGHRAWNRGLTKDTDIRIKIQAENRIGQKRTKETKLKMSLAKKGKYNGKNNPFYGKHHTDNSKNMISKVHKGKIITEQHRQQISKKLKGKKAQLSHEGRRRLSECARLRMLGSKLSEQTRNKMSKNHMTKRGYKPSMLGKKMSIESRLKMSQYWKEKFKDENWAKNRFLKYKLKPNKVESKLNELLQKYFPNEWKYVGDGYTWIAGKNPDFMNINGKKLLIELFGKYWHKEEECPKRIKHFQKYGFETLIIWDYELKNILETINRIKDFELKFPNYNEVR